MFRFKWYKKDCPKLQWETLPILEKIDLENKAEITHSNQTDQKEGLT